MKKYSYSNLETTVSFLGHFKAIIIYIIEDIKKKPRSFKIGIFTIFLVIGFLSAIQSCF